jgi:L-threonylcarbamoyladenylate synthase
VVGLPTETVYGLAADATRDGPVERVFEIKGRPRGHPLIVHLASPDDLPRVSPGAPGPARRLAALAWPGPLTVIVPRGPEVVPTVTGGRDTVGVRVPGHELARRTIELAGVPVAAPSANRFGAVSPTTAGHVLDDLADRLDLDRDCVLDGGPSPIGVESTIVDCTVDPPQLLRVGAVTRDEVAELLGAPVADARGPARASGMLASHYAPRCEVRLVDHRDDAEALAAGTRAARIIDHDDLGRYAASLYDELRRADADGVRTVIAVLPPAAGLGLAIRDRLTKAAAPRPTARPPGSR